MSNFFLEYPLRARDSAHRVACHAFADANHGLYLGHDRDGWRHAAAQHSVMVLGPPRSGKTSSLIIPNVLGANGPVVSTSTKPDVLEATLGARERLGECLLFDPTASVDRPKGIRRLQWSPVPGCLSWRTALATARSLVVVGSPATGATGTRGDGSHWTERAEALLAPLLHAAALEGADMRTLLTWVDRRQALPAQQILAFQPAGTGEIARNLLDGIVTTDERELSGIWSTTSGALGGFRSEEALATTAAPDFDPARFVRSSDTVYIAAPAHHQALVAPLVVGVLEGIRHAAYARAATGLSGSDPPVVLALDELANIAPIPDLPSMVSEGGGQGVVTLACFQDLSQARHRWPAEAEGFPSLFGTTVVLPGIGDVRTLEALSVLAGEEELITRSVSSGRALSDHLLTDLLSGGRPHVGDHHATVWRRRLPPEVLTHGMDGYALAFDHRNRPGWVPLSPSHLAEPWRTMRSHGRELERTSGTGPAHELAPGSERPGPVLER